MTRWPAYVIRYGMMLFISLLLLSSSALAQDGEAGSESDAMIDATVADGSAGNAAQQAYEPQQRRSFSLIIEQMKTMLTGAHYVLYQGLLSPMSNIVSALIVLYIMILGIGFALGMTPFTSGEVMRHLLKIVFLGAMVSPFGADLFNEQVLPGILYSVDELVMVITRDMAAIIDPKGPYAPGNAESLAPDMISPITPIDLLVGRLIGLNTFENLTEVASIDQIGIFYMFALAATGVFFFAAVAKALWIYLIAILAIILLIGLAPVFLAFFLFRSTHYLFLGWVNQIIQFTLQPVILFAFLSLSIIGIDRIIFLGHNGSLDSFLFRGTSGTALLDILQMPGETGSLARQDLLISLIIIAMVSYIFYMIVSLVPQLVRDITGRFVVISSNNSGK